MQSDIRVLIEIVLLILHYIISELKKCLIAQY